MKSFPSNQPARGRMGESWETWGFAGEADVGRIAARL